jgi:hypothetical protein
MSSLLKKGLIASVGFAATCGIAMANGGTVIPAPCPLDIYVGAGLGGDFVYVDANSSLTVTRLTSGVFNGSADFFGKPMPKSQVGVVNFWPVLGSLLDQST